MGYRKPTARQSITLLWCVVFALLSGCIKSEPEVNVGTRTVAHSPQLEQLQEHDFGAVVADGQVLRHEFALENSTDRPIRILRAMALRPCCSTIDSVAKSVEPGSKVAIPVSLKTSNGSGLQNVRFVVETDEKEKTTHVLGLRARLVPSWEVESQSDGVISLPIGEAGRQRFRVTARWNGANGRRLPEKLSALPPLDVRFAGEATGEIGSDGVQEATREVEVTIPASGEPGDHRSEIVFGWPEGRSESRLIVWEVRPLLEVSPPALFLPSSPEPFEQKIVVTSHGRPFRVVAVRSSLLAEPTKLSSEARLRQELTLKINPGDTQSQRLREIEIQTDHPGQTKLSLSALVLRHGREHRP